MRTPFSLSNTGLYSVQAMQGRKEALWLLSLPMLLELLAFAVVVWLTAFGHNHQSLTYLTSLAYLMASIVWLPAYIASFGWFWFKSKNNPDWVRLMNYFPAVVAALIWFPSTIITHVELVELIKIYLLLAVAAIVVGALFIAVIRIILRYWKEV